MFLRIENWSIPLFLSKLKSSGLPCGDHILKVYASDSDPRKSEFYDRDTITVFEVDDSPFADSEVYDYGVREKYFGRDLNQSLEELNLDERATRRLRALFRFANSRETLLVQTAMELTNSEGGWLIQHPFEDIDGISQALADPERYSETVHLDIFVPQSLERISELLGVDNLKQAEGIVTYEEITERTSRLLREGKHNRGNER